MWTSGLLDPPSPTGKTGENVSPRVELESASADAIPRQLTSMSTENTSPADFTDVPGDAPESLDVIAVGAHPDDVEIGCGGTLARLVQQDYDVGIVDLTDGEPTPLGSPEIRAVETAAATDVLGLEWRENLGLPNRSFF